MYDFGMVKPFLVLSTRSCLPYARQVVESIGHDPERILYPDDFDYTEKLQVMKFADGELEVILNASVRGRVVFLFTTSGKNDAGIPVEECKIELYHTIDVLRRSQAKEIVIFEPYISCSRSDRTTRRNSVGMWIHYKILVSLGTDHLVTYQLHSDKSKTVFDPCLCSIDDVPAVSLLQKYLCDTTIRTADFLTGTVRSDWLFCSVDAGGEKLARRFSTAFGTQLVVAHKQRNYDEPNSVESISLLSAVPIEGKTVWVVDDMIDTGGSIYGLLPEISKKNCREINIMIVHPILSDPAVERLVDLKKRGILNRLVVCDTVCCRDVCGRLPFMEVISSCSLSARIILTISQERQMATLIDAFSPAQYLSEPGLPL
jgi:ribose-phosphate pyrophosphokinase